MGEGAVFIAGAVVEAGIRRIGAGTSTETGAESKRYDESIRLGNLPFTGNKCCIQQCKEQREAEI